VKKEKDYESEEVRLINRKVGVAVSERGRSRQSR
jgi:hypothetical protein